MKELYSFSKLDSWDNCEAEWKLNYLDGRRDEFENNYFGLVGGAAHYTIEEHLRGNISRDQTLNHFLEQYYEVKKLPPFRNIGIAMERDMKAYFSNRYKGFPKLQNLIVEEEIHVNMGDWWLRGFIDLSGMDKDRNIFIIDHKISNPLAKSWDIKKKRRQLYLYSTWIKQKYGVYPKMLSFNFMKSAEYPAEHIPFNVAHLKEAIDWANESVRRIRKATSNEKHMYKGKYVGEAEFYCDYLCGAKLLCPLYQNKEKLAKLLAVGK